VGGAATAVESGSVTCEDLVKSRAASSSYMTIFDVNSWIYIAIRTSDDLLDP